jgi:hemerythrin-like metal-binding protein
MVFEWKSEYSVNVSEIDEQHKIFINILNKLYTSINHSETDSSLTIILKELVDYAHTHFATEEKYFDKFNYDFSIEHKAEHAHILDQIASFEKLHSEKKKDISMELIDFLEDWLITHILEQDKKFTYCFNSHGLF